MNIFFPIMNLLAVFAAILRARIGCAMVGGHIPGHFARSAVGRHRNARFWSCRSSLLP